MDEINRRINSFFKTDVGYLHILKLVKSKLPFLVINENNLENIKIEKMDYQYFLQSGFVGEYVASKNLIKLFFGHQVINISESEIIETFTHEFIHLLTSEYDHNGMLLQGFNMRSVDNVDSYFIGLNEGITQMIAEDVLGIKKSDAYPFETNIARKLAVIIGKEKLIELYSKHDIDGLITEIAKIDLNFDMREFIIKVYCLHDFISGTNYSDALGLGTEVEQLLIDLYQKSGKDMDEDFSKLIIDKKMADEMAALVPNSVKSGSTYLYYDTYNEKDMALVSKEKGGRTNG